MIIFIKRVTIKFTLKFTLLLFSSVASVNLSVNLFQQKTLEVSYLQYDINFISVNSGNKPTTIYQFSSAHEVRM